MSKHTPGPWYWAEYYDDTGGIYRRLERSPGEIVIDGELGVSVNNENARLIAAAPEMLEALKAAEHAMNYMGDVLNGMDAVLSKDVDAVEGDFEKVRAALAKAEDRA